jgi:hypothetical protein
MTTPDEQALFAIAVRSYEGIHAQLSR